MIDPESLNRFIVGTAEAVEAEYGATSFFGGAYVVYHTWNGEDVSVDGYPTLEAAKASLGDAPRNQIEYL